MNLLRSESFKKGIVFSVAFNVIAKTLAFVNSMAIAFFFGAQTKTDVYFYLFATITLIIGFVSSLDNSVIIPESMRIRAQQGKEKSMFFLNGFLYLYTIIGILLVALLILNPIRIFQFVSGFDTAELVNSKSLIFWFIPLSFLMLIVNYLTSILASYKYFTLPMIAGVINNIFSLCFLLIFHKNLDIVSLVAGLLTGYFVNIILLSVLMKTQLQWDFSYKRFSLDSKVAKNMGYASIGNLATFFSSYSPFYIMSNFNPGMVTMFNYSRNLADIPTQMISNQFSIVSAIRFNELSAKGETAELNKIFLQITGFLLFILTPIVSLILLFSNPIIKFFYEHGAFNNEDVHQTAYLLRFLSFTIIFYAINTMIARLFMATQKIKESLVFQISMNIMLIILITTASHFFSVKGYVAGNLAFQIIAILLSYVLLKKYFPFVDYSAVLKKLFACLLVNTGLAAVFYLFTKDYGLNIISIGFLSGLYLLIIMVINHFLNIDKYSKEYLLQILQKLLPARRKKLLV